MEDGESKGPWAQETRHSHNLQPLDNAVLEPCVSEQVPLQSFVRVLWIAMSV